MDINPATSEPVAHRHGAGTYAALKGHPVHPMLVPLAVGTYCAAVFADVAFASTQDPFWARSACWLLLAALLAGCVTAIPGVMDFLSVDRARTLPAARLHAIANSTFLIIVALDYARRMHHPNDVPVGGLPLTLFGLMVMVFAGWQGGAMVYRHGIGVSPGIGLAPEPGTQQGDSMLTARAEGRHSPAGYNAAN